MSQPTQKRIILKIWPEGGRIRDNIAEINAYTNTTSWRVACSERLLSEPGKGACFVLFVLEPVSPPSTISKLERRLVVSVAPDAKGVIRDNIALVNAYVAAGWTVACSEKLLDDAASSLSYVLYVMSKPVPAATSAPAPA